MELVTSITSGLIAEFSDYVFRDYGATQGRANESEFTVVKVFLDTN